MKTVSKRPVQRSSAIVKARSLNCFVLWLAAVGSWAPATSSVAHDGRRFEVEVSGHKLQAQGVNTGPSDGVPAVRPYVNAIHDHWRNFDALNLATADLPGFDIPISATALVSHDLWLDLLRVRKWVDPPVMPSPGTRPNLRPLDPGELITIFGNNDVNSTELGSILLAEDIAFGGTDDIDLLYLINSVPTDEIHVLEFRLRATFHGGGADPALSDSDTVYAILSPAGNDPVARLHHASLYLESYVTTIPEPSTAMLVAWASTAAAILLRRRPQGNFAATPLSECEKC
jgi:hypothetical protein